MSNHLTDRKFWERYWESKTGLSQHIPPDYLFSKQLQRLKKDYNISTAIELGGFPGYYAVFLKKYLQLDVALLDYFIHPPITAALLEKNGLVPDDITVIEADLFNYDPSEQYDLVLSCGLIEHFEDTSDIIERHINFMKPGGVLFITLPNFHAVNGWFQRKFDKENYDKHNLKSMDPTLLRTICEKAGLTVVQSGYFGKFSIWLENESEKPLRVRLLKQVCWFTGKVLSKIVGVESKKTSPYIVLEAFRK